MGVVRFTGKPGVSREGEDGGGALPLEHLWRHMHGPAPHQKHGAELSAEVRVGA